MYPSPLLLINFLSTFMMISPFPLTSCFLLMGIPIPLPMLSMHPFLMIGMLRVQPYMLAYKPHTLYKKDGLSGKPERKQMN